MSSFVVSTHWEFICITKGFAVSLRSNTSLRHMETWVISTCIWPTMLSTNPTKITKRTRHRWKTMLVTKGVSPLRCNTSRSRAMTLKKSWMILKRQLSNLWLRFSLRSRTPTGVVSQTIWRTPCVLKFSDSIFSWMRHWNHGSLRSIMHHHSCATLLWIRKSRGACSLMFSDFWICPYQGGKNSKETKQTNFRKEPSRVKRDLLWIKD